jgi:hypothetical protein
MQTPPKEYMTKLMTLVDDVKDSIPEGKYLELCNTMKDLFENKKVSTREWKTHTFDIHSRPTISFNKKYYIEVAQVHKKNGWFDSHTWTSTEKHVEFIFSDIRGKPIPNRGRLVLPNDSAIRMSVNDFNDYLHSTFKLYEVNKIKYGSTLNTIEEGNSIMTRYLHTFRLEDYAINEIKRIKREREIERYMDAVPNEDIEDDDRWDYVVNNSSDIFQHNIASNIKTDIETLIDKLIK